MAKNSKEEVTRRQFLIGAGATLAGAALAACEPVITTLTPPPLTAPPTRLVPTDTATATSSPVKKELAPTPTGNTPPKTEPKENVSIPTEFVLLQRQLLVDYLTSPSYGSTKDDIDKLIEKAKQDWKEGRFREIANTAYGQHYIYDFDHVQNIEEAVNLYLTIEFAKSPQVKSLNDILVSRWNIANNWISAEDKFLIHTPEFLQLALMIKHLGSQTDLFKRLAAIGKVKFKTGIPYHQRESSFCAQLPFLVTEPGWRSLHHNYITQLNLALAYAVFCRENGGRNPGLFHRLQTGVAFTDPYNAHIGMEAYANEIDKAVCGYIPDPPSPYEGIFVSTQAARKDKKPDTIGQTSDRLIYMFTDLIIALRCFGDPDIPGEEMRELEIYAKHDFKEPVEWIIKQYNLKGEWFKGFRAFYEGFAKFCQKNPEWSFIFNENLMQFS